LAERSSQNTKDSKNGHHSGLRWESKRMSEFLSAYFQREHGKLRDLICGGTRDAFLGAAELSRLELVYHLVQQQIAQFEADARSDYALTAGA
jgi:hypothetical protein